MAQVLLVTGVAVLAFSVSACAPDSMQNYKATGYNAFLDKIAAECKPLVIGASDIGEAIKGHNVGATEDSGYTYFLDMTSRLYYGRISTAEYRDSLTGILGSGTYNKRAFECIFSSLPAQRPGAPGMAPTLHY